MMREILQFLNLVYAKIIQYMLKTFSEFFNVGIPDSDNFVIDFHSK